MGDVLGDLGLLNAIAESRDLYLPESVFGGFLLLSVLAGIYALTRHIAGRLSAWTLTAIGLATFVFDGHIFIAVAILLAVTFPFVRRNSRSPAPDLMLHRELAVVVAGFGLYEAGRLATRADATRAFQNADHVMKFQDALWLPQESMVQQYLLPHMQLTRTVNLIYSHAFLATVIGVLIWLFYSDERNYRLYRNALAISALLTVAISGLFPVAPPRLATPNIVDTHILMGGHHGFINEFAAVPSLHVGWTALAGLMIARSLGSWRGALGGATLPVLIGITVIVTGNHYWIDGVVGIAICVGPAYLLIKRDAVASGFRSLQASAVRHVRRIRHGARGLASEDPTFVLASSSLGALLAFLVIGQLVAAGFTDHWGYLTAQITATLLLVAAFKILSSKERLIQPLTHVLIFVATAADVFGTTQDLYANYAIYDKFVHAVGTAAFTAVVLDIIVGLSGRQRLQWPLERIVLLGMVAGVSAGVLWEVYELVGDRVFDSARIGGIEDTTFDLISDTVGALAVGAAWFWIYQAKRTRQRSPYLESALYQSELQHDGSDPWESYSDESNRPRPGEPRPQPPPTR